MESAINQPHPDTSEEDAEAFFGEPQPEEPQPAQPQPEEPQPEEQDESQVAEPQVVPEARPEPDGDPPEPDGDPPEPQAAAGSQEPAGETRSLSREYIVFQKLSLNARTLKHLLTQLEEGKAVARVAFVELHRPVTRNDKAAVGLAYAVHQQALGERCELAAVSARAFKVRHVEPDEVPAERRVRIS